MLISYLYVHRIRQNNYSDHIGDIVIYQPSKLLFYNFVLI